MKKGLLKKVLSIFIIITMLINILPNFSLLSRVQAADNKLDKGLVLQQIAYDETNKVIEIGLFVRNTDIYAGLVDISYSKDIMQPINATVWKAANLAMAATDANGLWVANVAETGLAYDTSVSQLKDGSIDTMISATATGGSGEAFDSAGTDTLLATIYFQITDENTTIDDITNDMFGCNSLEIETNSDVLEGTDLFAVEVVNSSAPTITSIEIVSNPTTGKTYVHGTEVDLTGLKLTVNYSDGTKKENITIADTDLTVTPEGTITAEGKTNADIDNTEISFKYKGQPDTVEAARLTLNVIDPVKELVVNDPNGVLTKPAYSHGEDITIQYITITPKTISGKSLAEITLPDAKIAVNDTQADMTKIENPTIKEDGLYSGLQKITFTYTNETVTGEVIGTYENTVVAEASIIVNDEIDSIAISEKNPPIAEYTLGDNFEKNGDIVVKGTSNTLPYGEIAINSANVTVQEKKADGSLADVDLSTPGTKTLVVTYQGKTAEYTITVKDPVDHLEIIPSTAIEVPYDTEFASIDLSNVKVAVVRKSGAKEEAIAINRDWIDSTNYDKTAVGEIGLTVKHTVEEVELTGTLTIDVQDKLLGIVINSDNMKTEYEYGEELDITGATITLNYASGDQGPYPFNPDDVEVDGYDKLTAGEQDVTITYTESNGETASTIVKVTVNDTAEELRATLNKEYISGSTIPLADVVAKLWKASDLYKEAHPEAGTPAPADTTDITLQNTTATGTGVQTITVTYNQNNALTTTVKALVLPTGLTAVYEQTLADVTLPSGFEWAEPEATEVGIVGNNTHTVNYTGTDDYEGTKTGLEVTVTVTAKPATVPTVNPIKVYEGETLADVTLPTLANGTLEWIEGIDLTAPVYGATGLKAIYTDDDENLEPVEVNIVLDVQTIKKLEVTLGKQGYASDEAFNVENTVTKVEAIFDDNERKEITSDKYTVSIADGATLVEGINTAVVTYVAESGTKTENVQVLRLPEKQTIEYAQNKTLADFPIGNGFEWVNGATPIEVWAEREENIKFVVPAGTEFNGLAAGTTITTLTGLDKFAVNVEVTKGTLNVNFPTGLQGIDQDELSTIDLSSYNTADGTFEWVNPTTKLSTTIATYQMKYTPTDENYSPILKSVNVAVKPIEITSLVIKQAPTKAEYIQEENLNTEGLEVIGIKNNGQEVDLTNSVTVEDGKVLSIVGINTIPVSYPIKDEDGNVTKTLTDTFNVFVLPTGYTAIYGDKLSTVALPDGFAWADSYSADQTVGNATTENTTNDFSVEYTIPVNTTLTIGGVEYNAGEKYEPTTQVGIEVEKATLVKADLDYTEIADKDYTGTPTTVEVSVTKTDGAVTVNVYDESGNIVTAPTNAGTYTVKASVAEGTNYKALAETELYSFTINKINPTFTAPTGLTAIYGDALSSVALAPAANGTFTWEEADTTSVGNAGLRTHTVKFTPNDTTNYNEVTAINVTIDVAKADPDYTLPTGLTAEYGDTLADVTLPEGFTWDDDTLPVGNVGEENKHTVTFTPADTDNYNTLTGLEVTVEVEKSAPEVPEITDLTAEYGETLADVELPTADNGTFTWEEPDTTPVGNVGDRTHKVTFTPNDTDSYKVVTGIDVIITVTKATITEADLSYDLPAPRNYDGQPTTVDVTVAKTDGAVTVEYYNEAGTKVTAPTDAGTYTVKVTVAEGTNYKGLSETTIGSFVINKATLDISIEKQTIEYDADNKLADIVLPTHDKGTLTWVEAGTTLLGGIGTKTYHAKFTPTDNTNYNEIASIPVVVEVTKATPTFTVPTGLTAEYGTTLSTVDLSSYNTADGTFTWEEAGTTLVGDVGTVIHKVTYTPTDLTNYDPVTEIEVGIEVTKASITIDDVHCTMPSPRPYDGTVTTLVPTVDKTNGAVTLKYYNESGTEVTAPTDAGTYTVKVKVAEGTNYFGLAETTIGSFTITKAAPTVTVDKQTITYSPDNTLADVTLPTLANGTLTWVEAESTVLGSVGEKTYHAKFTPTDTTNYDEIASIDVIVEVTKADPSYTIPTGLTVVEGQTLADVQGLPAGFAWEEDLTTSIPLVSVGGNTYSTTVTFTPDDTTNYNIKENIPVEISVVENEVDSIEIVTGPTKTEYFEGQVFDPEGMVVRAHYKDGTSSNITGYTIDDEDKELEIGDTSITVRYKDDHTATVTINVIADYVTGIEVKAPTKLEYKYNEDLDLTGGTVKKVMASGVEQTAESLTSDMISGYDKTTLGVQGITVTYAGVSNTNAFQVEVKDYVTGISIKNPDRLKTQYQYGDEITVGDKETGAKLYIQVDYAGGTPSTPVELTKSMISGFNMTQLGTQQVTVTYEGMTTKYSINVSDYVKGIDIVKEPTKKVYKLGETLDTTGLVVRNVMASDETAGSTLTASEYTISALDSTTTGGKTITITKTGTTFTDTFNVVVIDPVSDMQINELPKTEYTFGDSLSLTGGSIIVKTENDNTGRIIPMTDPSVTVTGYSSNRLGRQNLTVTYTYTENVDSEEGIITETKTMTAHYSVNVEDAWSGQITVERPTKLTYNYGEELDLTGGTVAKLMLSGSVEDRTDLTGAMVSGYNPETVGTQYITVTHWGKTTGFNVTVVDKTYGISINTLPDKTVYNQGENLDLTGATINVTKDSGIKQIPVTPDMITGYDANKVGDQLVTINYDGYTAKFVVTVNKVETPEKPSKPNKPTKPTKPTTPTRPTTPQKEEYLVIFVDFDGRILRTETVEKGKSATAPITPSREQYIFEKWDVTFDNITSDLTVKAVYKVDESNKMIVEGLEKEYEIGEEIDLDDVIVRIATDDGVVIVPVTKDMIEYMDNESVETRTIIVTYTDKNGKEYVKVIAAKLKKPNEFKQEVLGVQDEADKNNNSNDILISAAIGAGVTGVLLLLLALINRKNVEIYAVTEDRRKLLGKEKISKNNTKISLYEYAEQLTAADAEILIKERMSKKLDGEYVEVDYEGNKTAYKIKARDGEDFIIIIKNKDEE